MPTYEMWLVKPDGTHVLWNDDSNPLDAATKYEIELELSQYIDKLPADRQFNLLVTYTDGKPNAIAISETVTPDTQEFHIAKQFLIFVDQIPQEHLSQIIGATEGSSFRFLNSPPVGPSSFLQKLVSAGIYLHQFITFTSEATGDRVVQVLSESEQFQRLLQDTIALQHESTQAVVQALAESLSGALEADHRRTRSELTNLMTQLVAQITTDIEAVMEASIQHLNRQVPQIAQQEMRNLLGSGDWIPLVFQGIRQQLRHLVQRVTNRIEIITRRVIELVLTKLGSIKSSKTGKERNS